MHLLQLFLYCWQFIFLASEPEHIKTCPVKDPWGNDYLFQRIDKENYVIATAGSDGNFLGFEQAGKYSAQSLSGQDIILKTGTYVFAPE